MDAIYAYDLRVDSICSDKNGYIINQLIITINNTDDEPLWIWFDDEGDKKKDGDERTKIRWHFLRHRVDFSIFEIATDANMSGQLWTDSTPIELFVKYLEPHHSFTIVIYKESADGIKKDIGFSTDVLRIYSRRILQKYCPGMEQKYSIERISFPYDVFLYPV